MSTSDSKASDALPGSDKPDDGCEVCAKALPVADQNQLAMDDGYCPKREDETHCEHWWDGDAPCCSCKHPGGAQEQARG